jgi:hypothetical protein
MVGYLGISGIVASAAEGIEPVVEVGGILGLMVVILGGVMT